MSMNCQTIRKYLPLYVGRDLPDANCKEVALHLVECEACQAQVKAYQEAHKALAELGSQNLMPRAMDLLQRNVRHRVRRHGFHGLEAQGSGNHLKRWYWGGAVAAGLAALVAARVISGLSSSDDSKKVTPTRPPYVALNTTHSPVNPALPGNRHLLQPPGLPEETEEVEILFPIERVHSRLDFPFLPESSEMSAESTSSQEKSHNEWNQPAGIRAKLVKF